jgi:hypothetical protein
MALALRIRHRLAWEITITLVLKLVIIYLIWLAFFSRPLDEHLTAPAVGTALFGTPAPDTTDSTTDKNTPGGTTR